MNESISITVAVISYNPVWEKLRNTLKSIVCQKTVDFEIIIADDGSANDCFNETEQYLNKLNFTNYKLIKNLVNQGIVKNVLSAVKAASGKYTKLISPGDFLYDENTLEQFVIFAERNPAAFYFGDMFYYYLNESCLIKLFRNKKNPIDLRPWKKNDKAKIRWNYLVNCDYICGAATMYNTQKLYEYITKISSFIKYAEDCSLIYMIANNEDGYYIKVKGVFYEHGAGISTQKTGVWNERLITDNKNLFAQLLKDKSIPKWIYKLHFSESKTERRILRFIHNPKSYLPNFLSQKIKGYEDRDFDINKLKKILQN